MCSFDSLLLFPNVTMHLILERKDRWEHGHIEASNTHAHVVSVASLVSETSLVKNVMSGRAT